MSDDNEKKCCWGGLVKTIIAGAAIAIGVEMVTGGMLTTMVSGLGSGAGAAGGGLLSNITAEGVGEVIKRVAGAVIAGMGLAYVFSDGKSNENAEQHAQNYREAKESFAIREDMRKMQTVMKMRMQANGQDMAAAGPQMG